MIYGYVKFEFNYLYLSLLKKNDSISRDGLSVYITKNIFREMFFDIVIKVILNSTFKITEKLYYSFQRYVSITFIIIYKYYL